VNMQNDVAEYLQVHGGQTEERRMMYLICKAVKKHDKRLLKQLLQWFNGSIVTDLNGQSVYHVCIRNGDLDMLKTLIKAGISKRNISSFY
jgi:ankyrin repeat protein